MRTSRTQSICLIPHLTGLGGMVSFQHKLSEGLQQRGIRVAYDLRDTPYSAVLVIGGTKDLPGLYRARQHGIKIVQRLNGMNWLHRRLKTGLRHYIRAEYGNLLLAYIRSRLAHHIVYQSQFSKKWWEEVRGAAPVSSEVVYNGVDLERFTPVGSGERPVDHFRLLLVEASLAGGYEMGLETAVLLAEQLRNLVDLPLELVIAGRVEESLRQTWQNRASLPLRFIGQVPHHHIPELDRSAHLLYSADLNAACPNAVIEALACGLPVVAFDTGALSELVVEGSGKVVPYGGSHWKLDRPDITALARAGADILRDLDGYRTGARARAEAAFGLDFMVNSYVKALNNHV
jgi:glycosyltransferase involved in cell wall biosynthesis